MSEIQDSASKAPNVKALPKWEQTARDRVKTNLPKTIKPIQELMERICL